jgi:alpha-mannosidase
MMSFLDLQCEHELDLSIVLVFIINLSSGMVYDDAERLYGEVKASGESLLDEALSVLFPDSLPLGLPRQKYSRGSYGRMIGYNTTFLRRWDIIKIPLQTANSTLKAQIMQASDDGKEGYAVMTSGGGTQVGELRSPSSALHTKLLPASGAFLRFFFLRFGHLIENQIVYTNGSDHFVLRNSGVQLTISKGRITSVLDVKLK